jgi:hypothetical protein
MLQVGEADINVPVLTMPAVDWTCSLNLWDWILSQPENKFKTWSWIISKFFWLAEAQNLMFNVFKELLEVPVCLLKSASWTRGMLVTTDIVTHNWLQHLGNKLEPVDESNGSLQLCWTAILIPTKTRFRQLTQWEIDKPPWTPMLQVRLTCPGFPALSKRRLESSMCGTRGTRSYDYNQQVSKGDDLVQIECKCWSDHFCRDPAICEQRNQGLMIMLYLNVFKVLQVWAKRCLWNCLGAGPCTRILLW